MDRRAAFWFLLVIYLGGTLCADESIILEKKEIKKAKEEFYPNDDADTRNAQKPEFLCVEPEDRQEGQSISFLITGDEDIDSNPKEIPSFCSFPIDYSDPNPLTRWSVVYNSPNHSHPVVSTDANSSSLSDNHHNMCSNPEKIKVDPENLREISITNGSNAVYYAYVWKSYAFKFMKPPGPIVKCTVHQKTINPMIENNGWYNTKPKFVLLDKPTCNFILLNMRFQTAGDWEFTTYYIDTTNSNNTILKQKHNIRLVAISSYVQTTEIMARKGEYRIVSLNEKYTENATCKYFDQNYKELTGDEKWATPNGKCSIRILFYSQTSIIIRAISGYTSRDEYFNIESDQEIKKHFKHWKTGSVGRFKPNAFENNACKLIKPDGTNITLESPQCNYTINNVSSMDQGTWTARYYLNDNTSVDEYYIINVWDPQSVWITVDKTSKSINLACRTVEKYKNCTFEKLNGTFVDYRHSVPIRQNYPTEEPLSECLLQIYSPTEKHYGTWRCSMGYEGFNVSRNFTLEKDIKEIGQSEAFEIDGTSYVMKGDKFQIKCPCDGSLKYCLIKSPDQVTYSVLENKTFFNSPKTINNEITIDNCSVTINYANNTHEGLWMREYSFNNNTVVQTNFMLKVMHVMAGGSTPTSKKRPTFLGCLLMSANSMIESTCSWRRPDGRNIFEFYSDYTTKHDSCELHIHALSPKDRGNWTCYVKMKNGFNKTFSSTVELEFEPEIFMNTSKEQSTNIESHKSFTTGIPTDFPVLKNADRISSNTTTTLTMTTIRNNINVSLTRVNGSLNTTSSEASSSSNGSITTLNFSSTTVFSVNAPARKTFMSDTTLIPNGEKIYHCEWIHPNGSHLIENDSTIDKSKYIFTQNDVQCQLELNYWNNKDYGSWQYCIYLSKNLTEKVCDKFDFFENSEDFSSPLEWILSAAVSFSSSLLKNL